MGERRCFEHGKGKPATVPANIDLLRSGYIAAVDAEEDTGI